MHSNEVEDIESIGPGDVCAIFGVECSSGDTFTDGSSFSMVGICVAIYQLILLLDGHVCPRTGYLAVSQTERL